MGLLETLVFLKLATRLLYISWKSVNTIGLPNHLIPVGAELVNAGVGQFVLNIKLGPGFV